jgi:hypothetical protein
MPFQPFQTPIQTAAQCLGTASALFINLSGNSTVPEMFKRRAGSSPNAPNGSQQARAPLLVDEHGDSQRIFGVRKNSTQVVMGFQHRIDNMVFLGPKAELEIYLIEIVSVNVASRVHALHKEQSIPHASLGRLDDKTSTLSAAFQETGPIEAAVQIVNAAPMNEKKSLHDGQPASHERIKNKLVVEDWPNI